MKRSASLYAGCIHIYGHGGESSAVIDPVLGGGPGPAPANAQPQQLEFSPWAVAPGSRGYLWVVDKATQTVHKLKYLD